MHETRWKHVRKFSQALLLPWNWQGTERGDPHLLSQQDCAWRRAELGKEIFPFTGRCCSFFSSPPRRHLLGELGRTGNQSPEMLKGSPTRKSEQGLGLFGLCVLSVVESRTQAH